MSHSVAEPAQRFGGSWTETKLEILRAYLDAYTTALKKQSFQLCYVDAFAGSGAVEMVDDADEDKRQLLQGSPFVALGVQDKPFDQLVLIEQDPGNARSLRQSIAERGALDRVQIIIKDANVYLPKFCAEMRSDARAVVFLDPFGAQVDWATVESIAKTRKCDTWILFPVSTIRRLLPRRGEVRTRGNEARLTRVFGDESWRDLQRESRQRAMFQEFDTVETDPGVAKIVERYKSRLESVFAEVAPSTRTLRNSRNSPLYEFMFAASNKRGARVAVRIANHILTEL